MNDFLYALALFAQCGVFFFFGFVLGMYWEELKKDRNERKRREQKKSD